MFKSSFVFLFVFISLSCFPAYAVSPQSLTGKKLDLPNSIHKVGIIGEDDRSYDLEGYTGAETGVGLLISSMPGASWSCSSFCVADNVAVTNAHCLFRPEKTNLRFVHFGFPEYYNDNVRISNVSRVNFADDENIKISVLTGAYRKGQQKNDWALVQLSSPVCKGRVLQVENTGIKQLTRAGRKKRIFMIGFHGDKYVAYPIVSKNCKIYSGYNRRYFPIRHQRNRYLIGHTCDSFQGSSGSPIFMKTKDGFRVVAINSGEYKVQRYQVQRDYYTGRIYGPRRLVYRRSINVGILVSAFIDKVPGFSEAQLLMDVVAFKELQLLLKQLKYYRGPIDGIHGRGTRNAILRFEKKNDLPTLGFPTQDILRLLREKTGVEPEKGIR